MGEPDVFEGSMRIAREEYPALDIARYRARLDAFARQARPLVTERGRKAVLRLNDFFFDRLGFRGNADDYYDPRNSYLNDVIDRRTGIPITLATVYCEVARRLGLEAHGVGFPGHFLAKVLVPRAPVIVDVFNAKVLTRKGCERLLESLAPGKEVTLSDSMLEISRPREILARMLANLRRVHAMKGDYARAVRWTDLSIELDAATANDYRERGMLHIQLERFGRAIDDLEQYTRLVPDAPDLPQLREQIGLLRKLLSHLN
jgi:regulator of sirC expression with transglutaminase-like and TPR domain